MNSILRAVVAALCLLAGVTSADATQRTFVASYGNDASPCSLAAPCRGFAAALAKTSTDGEVIVLDSAGYGPFTITRAVSIIAPEGVYAGVTVSSGNGVWVMAGANDRVLLRGLTVNGQGGNMGIIVLTAGELHIENCTVANLRLHGIAVSNTIAGASRIFIRNTVVRDNGDAGLAVVQGTPEINIADSHFSHNDNWGLFVYSGTLSATRVVIADNGGPGIYTTPEGIAVIAVTDSVIARNGGMGVYGFAGSNATVRIAITGSTCTRNGLGGISVATFPSDGTAHVTMTVSRSALVANGNHGVSADGAGIVAIVTNSTLAANAAFDLIQDHSAELRTSGNNTLTGRGAADVSGTLMPNPLK